MGWPVGKSIITITDLEGGLVKVSLTFDPALDMQETGQPAPASHHIATDFLEWLGNQANIEDADLEPEGEPCPA